MKVLRISAVIATGDILPLQMLSSQLVLLIAANEIA